MFNERRVSFRDDEKVLETDGGKVDGEVLLNCILNNG